MPIKKHISNSTTPVILRKKRTTSTTAAPPLSARIERGRAAPVAVVPRPTTDTPPPTVPRQKRIQHGRAVASRAQPAPRLPVAPLPTPPAQSAPASEGRNRRQRAADAQIAFLTQLRMRWPQAFPTEKQAIRPLALGIHQDIAAAFPQASRWLIKETIARFQRSAGGAYWRAVLKGGPRYALDGALCGTITAAEQEHAQRTLATLAARGPGKQQSPPSRTTARSDDEGSHALAQAMQEAG